MKAGLYYILCERNGRIYIGQSGNVSRRFYEHRCNLSAGRHYNRQLQADWREHGEAAFTFGVLSYERDLRMRSQLEQTWINTYRADDPAYGYNVVSSKFDRAGVSDFARRFMAALDRLGTPAQQEAAFPDMSPRTLRGWRRGQNIPETLAILEAAGVIRINA